MLRLFEGEVQRKLDLQDRAYAVGIFIVLGICCLGAYVAVSGFFNANPSGLGLILAGQTPTQSAGLEVTTEARTSEAKPATALPLSTLTPGATATGVKTSQPTATSPSRGTPSPSFLSDLPTAILTSSSGTATATSASTGCGYPFCARPGPPSAADAPTGRPCPSDYLWGIVYDKSLQGKPGMEIHYQQLGVVSDRTTTKGPPDTRIGGYDINTGSGTWVLQLFAGGTPKSAPFSVRAGQPYSGGATCPTRVDFVEQ